MKIFFCKISLPLFLIVFMYEANGQMNAPDSIKIDSLKKVLQIQKEDTNKVNTLNALSAELSYNSDHLKALEFANKALGLAKKIKSKRSLAQSYQVLAMCFTNNENIPESLRYLYSALKLFEELGDKNRSADCLSTIGFNYYASEGYNQGLNAFFDALKIYNQIGVDNFYRAICYIYIANIYRIQANYDEALKYDSLGLKISLVKGLKHAAANAYITMGDILSSKINSSQLNKTKNEQKSSLREALKNYLNALNDFKDSRDIGGITESYQHVSEIYIRLHQFKEAQIYADSSFFVANQIHTNDGLGKSNLLQASIDSAESNFGRAYEHYKLYILHRDSLINEETTRKSLLTKFQYEAEKKEAVDKAEQDRKDAEQKRYRNQQYFIIAGLGILVLAILTVALIQFRNNKQKQKANLVIIQQKQKVETTLEELKSTQAQLIQSEKMASLGELTAGIAHEIQNPLNFVNNFSEVNKELLLEMKDEIDKGNINEVKSIADDLISNQEKINHHGQRADAIVKGMMQHSQQSKGLKEPANINALADEYLRLSYHGMRAKDKDFNAIIKTDFDENIGKINIIPQDIGRVLLNLYNNAFYACAERSRSSVNEKKGSINQEGFQNLLGFNYEPTVTVQTKKLNDKIEIKVSDNGNGIAKNIVDKIFQPFFTTKPTGQGTGLGLSLSYDIIKAHGGELKVETKEGEGSEFIIQLPVI